MTWFTITSVLWAESTVATQLGQITDEVADSKHDAGYAATAARLRVAASVFGS